MLLVQALACGVVAAYAAVITWGLLKILDKTVGLRVHPEDEDEGLDMSEHGEQAYHDGMSHGGAAEARVVTEPEPIVIGSTSTVRI